MARLSKSKSVRTTKEEAEKIISRVMQGSGFQLCDYGDGTTVWYKNAGMGTQTYYIYADVIGGYLTVEAWDISVGNFGREDALTFLVTGLTLAPKKTKTLMNKIYDAIN